MRISLDAKAKVKLGNFSRGGKSWIPRQASDHDFGKESITPFGLFLPKEKKTEFYFTQSKVTADFIVDVLEDFWDSNKMHYKQVHTLVLNLDNGPECHRRRTQFIKRLCEFSVEHDMILKLAYYPPYHSKYNPIERVWGGLEQYWNGDILDCKETVLNFANNFFWAGKRAWVKLWEGEYKTGNKLSVKEMSQYEQSIDRLDDYIGKWFVTISPNRVKEIFAQNSG